MLVSLNWLKQYIDLDDLSVDEIENVLTQAGLEVDEIKDYSKQFDKFVVGYVKERKKHPNADKLSVCVVNDGNEDLQIVCGAPNVDAGQKIVLAKVGAVVPVGDFEIKKAKIRGEHSFGMICSESELGISDNHDGIMVLDPDTKEGEDAAKVLGLDDVVYDISMTPNRADALHHYGVARDLGACLKRPVKFPGMELKESAVDKSESFASIEVEDTKGCGRYVGKVIKGVTVKESPEWMQRKLTAIGLRPINNIVDVSNYVLHEIGQPLHTFDLDKLAGNKIIVKQAGTKKKFVTLDSKERELAADDLMICDAEKEVAIAGIMGGENSEVTNTTTNVLIESAYFNPSYVRRTAKRLGLSSDASYRFERGVNREIQLWAAQRAAQLIMETGGGEICEGEIDIHPNPYVAPVIKLRYPRVEKLLGYTIAQAEVKSIFEYLGFSFEEETEEYLAIKIPGFRPDIEREIDLIEEVARIYGYDNIPPIEKITVTLEAKVDESAFNNKLSEILTSFGYFETLTNSLLNEQTASTFGKPIAIMNPQTIEMSHLRTSMVPGMLYTVAKNLKVKESNLNLFEIGNVFNLATDGEIKNFADFNEDTNLVIALTGKKVDTKWYMDDTAYSIYDLKGTVNALMRKISLDKVTKDVYHEVESDIYDNTFAKYFKKTQLGIGGKVKAEVLKKFDITQDVYLFELNLNELSKIQVPEKKFEELLKFPKVYRDVTFIVDKLLETGNIEEVMFKSSKGLLKNISLFDIFEGESIGADKKSITFRMEYFDHKSTLTDDKIDKEFWKSIERVKKEFNAEVRGS